MGIKKLLGHRDGVSAPSAAPEPPSDPPTVLLFLKEPIRGRVKTRLAAEIGDEMACTVYRGLAEATLAAVPAGWPIEVHFLGAEENMRAWLGERPRFFPQKGADLGEKLAHGVEEAFSCGTSGVILLGGDCPGVTSGRLRAAAASLAKGRSVIGPAVDGGYWTLGLPRPYPRVFQEVDWSTEQVFAQTTQRFSEYGEQPDLLEELEDIDDLASWTRFLLQESVLAK